jgi:microfibrillar-associated protein 1
MSTTIRKQAPRPARPAGRYWKGKAPKGAADLSSSDESDDGREVPQEEGDVAFAGEQEFLHAEHDGDEEEEQGLKGQRTGKMSVALKNVNISKEGTVLVDGRQEVGRTVMEGALSCPPIITDNYDNHLEPSGETEEETDAEAASQGETDDVSQPHVILLSLKGYPTIV